MRKIQADEASIGFWEVKLKGDTEWTCPQHTIPYEGSWQAWEARSPHAERRCKVDRLHPLTTETIQVERRVYGDARGDWAVYRIMPRAGRALRRTSSIRDFGDR